MPSRPHDPPPADDCPVAADDAALSDLRAELAHVLTDTLSLLAEVTAAVGDLPEAERVAADRLHRSASRLHALQETLQGATTPAAPIRTVRDLIDGSARLSAAAGVELRLAIDDGALRAPLDTLGDMMLNLVRAVLESAAPDDMIELGACIVNQRRLNVHLASPDNGEPLNRAAVDAVAMEAAVRGGRVDIVQAPFGPQRIFRVTAPLPIGTSRP